MVREALEEKEEEEEEEEEEEVAGGCRPTPKHFVLPRDCTEDMLEQVLKFRSSGRVPAATWMHPINGAVLVRSS